MASNKLIIQKTFVQRQEFTYQKNSATLKFNLRVDNSSELRDFRECMIEAVKDIDEILKGMKN